MVSFPDELRWVRLSPKLRGEPKESRNRCVCPRRPPVSSPQVYLAVHIASNPLEEEAVVISIGAKSFTVHVPRLGMSSRVYLDKIPDIATTFNDVERTLHLTASSGVTHKWTEATIKMFARVHVRCSVANKTGPIQVEIEFLRPK